MSTLSYTYNLTNGTTADANEVMGNFNSVASVVNGNIAAINIDETDNYTWSGINDFSTANSIKIPSTAPTASRAIAHLNNQLNIHDGTSARIYVPVDKASVGIHNIGWNLAGGAINIVAFGNVTSLSASNSGWISYPHTSGQWLSQPVTADQGISSGGLKGRWGTTASVAYGSDMPFAIGVCSSDGTAANIRFFLTRNPAMKLTPANTNNIGIDGTAPVTSDQGNIVLFGTGANTGYNSRPCRIIGAVRATCDATAGGVWTITAADTGDGIGTFYNFGSRVFTMPISQNGATAGKYFADNGGTAPTFTSENTYNYSVQMDGLVNIQFLFHNTAGGTAGAGAVAAQLALPATPLSLGAQSNFIGAGYAQGTSVATLGTLFAAPATPNLISLEYQTVIVTTTASILNSNLAAALRSYRGFAQYKAFS